jgi:DNA-binding MarR family transcriptional regulator
MPEQLMPNNFYTSETYTAKGSVGYLLRRAKTLMLGAFESALAERGFTFTQYIVLAWLREGIATTAKAICTELSHDSGALARVIDQLAERGLVERTRDLEDRRKVELRLTDLGRHSIEAVIPAVVDVMNWTISDFTREETVELLRLLAKFNASMEAKLGISGNCPDVKE